MGLLAWLTNLKMGGGAPAITAGPFFVKATDAYVSGAQQSQVHVSEAVAQDVYVSHDVVTEVARDASG